MSQGHSVSASASGWDSAFSLQSAIMRLEPAIFIFQRTYLDGGSRCVD